MRVARTAFAFLLLLTGCTPAAKDWYKSFDSDRAFSHVRKQVELGPRPAGSPELDKAAGLIETELKSYGLKVHRQAFEVSDTPRGTVRFQNVIGTTGKWPPQNDFILLASHYDTKWMPQIRFVGANDAGSSTGCLLEIARVLSKVRSKMDYVFVFFDGEEAFVGYVGNDGLYGSRRMAGELKTGGSLARARAMILLDMIGDHDLKVAMPNGDPTLIRAVFEAAQDLGVRDQFALMGAPLTDDHLPFQAEGVPSVDLIDFEYGPSNAYWHTEQDTLDKVSPKSLEIVGQTVLKVLESMNP